MGKKIVLDALGREMVVEENEELRPEPERDNRWLKIYIYEEDNGNKKYYIDIFAAVELGLYDYQEACQEYRRGGIYYYLTPALLKHLQEKFAGRIRYIYLANEKDKKEEKNEKDYYGYYPYQDYREFFDKVDNFKPEEPMLDETNNIDEFKGEFDNKIRR